MTRKGQEKEMKIGGNWTGFREKIFRMQTRVLRNIIKPNLNIAVQGQKINLENRANLQR